MNKFETEDKLFKMVEKGKRFAKFLPPNWRLLGVSPGYAFVDNKHGYMDVTESVLDTLLRALEKGGQNDDSI